MIKAAVVGATGYTGVELVDLLLKNSGAEIVSLSALVDKEEDFSDIFPRFKGRSDLVCKNFELDEVGSSADIVFLALPHTVSMKLAPELLKKGVKVIDLSADYRLPREVFEKWYSYEHSHPDGIEKAVYGLPELNREKIATADLIANPGCYPTSIILALKPIASLLASTDTTIIADSKTGLTGAGRKASIPLSFSEADGNFKCYKANRHQHMPEMEHVLSICAGEEVKINFVPHLLPVRRGIFSTIYITGLAKTEEELKEIYLSEYADEPFVRLSRDLPQLSDVRDTNFCDIGLEQKGDVTIVVSAIDNLLKGAAGQAVQNMNIMFSLNEKDGLV